MENNDLKEGENSTRIILEKKHIETIDEKSTHHTTKKIVLSWNNVNVFTPQSGIDSVKKCFKQKVPETKQIINNGNFILLRKIKILVFFKSNFCYKVCGIAKPFEILAILGASGSGKSTLLNVLNFRNSGQLRIVGDVRLNGQKINSIETLSSVSGYVQQDDLFISSLTVKEHLLFQVIKFIKDDFRAFLDNYLMNFLKAMLRMDKKNLIKERLRRIEEVLLDVNLFYCSI
jgi:ABC-type multidrug transport system fused ATPase/permease subunit